MGCETNKVDGLMQHLFSAPSLMALNTYGMVDLDCFIKQYSFLRNEDCFIKQFSFIRNVLPEC